MLTVRAAWALACDLVLFVVRSGRWWIPLLIVLLVTVAVVSLSAGVGVPTITYTLF